MTPKWKGCSLKEKCTIDECENYGELGSNRREWWCEGDGSRQHTISRTEKCFQHFVMSQFQEKLQAEQTEQAGLLQSETGEF